jgi:hypothetical protein
MKTINELITAIQDKKTLVWNDPDPIDGNDYTISWIEEIDSEFDEHTPILIHYNSNFSEAQVFLHEILLIEEIHMSNITPNQLIKDWKKSLESEWIQLDNLDEAKLVFDDEGNVVVENEHGTQFPVSDLSDTELENFYVNLT